jgi:LPS sulfotransferase NodH
MRNDMFMITCAARTGSTLLQSYLRSHPDTTMHGEVYTTQRTSDLAGSFNALIRDPKSNEKLTRWRDANQTAFLYKYIYENQGKKAVGHKLKHDELLLPKFAETRECIRRDTDIKIIHLYRKNLFERFVSWWVVNHVTGITMLTDKSKDPEFKPTVIPVAACQSNFNDTIARYNIFSGLFAKHRVLKMTYEDLTGPKRESVLAELTTFLEIDNIQLSSNLRKVTPKDLRQVVANLDEIVDYFTGTKYEQFFEGVQV